MKQAINATNTSTSHHNLSDLFNKGLSPFSLWPAWTISNKYNTNATKTYMPHINTITDKLFLVPERLDGAFS